MNAREQTITNILEHFGFKSRQSGKDTYFLQTKKQFKPMTKITMDKLLDLYVAEESVATKVKKVVTKKPAAKKKEEVKKDE